MSFKRKLTALSINEKLNIIKEIEEDHKTKKEICLKYKCNISTVSRILKKKHEIKKAASGSVNLKQKRNRKGVHYIVEKALGIWYNKQKQKSASVSSLVLIRKAKEFAIKFGDDFEPDSNWLFRWKKRYNIKLGNVHEKIPVRSKESAPSDTDILPDLIKQYSAENIMNAAESALFYKALPSETCQPGLLTSDNINQKVKFTLLFICNAAATFKRVYVIGKSKIPRYLQNVNTPVPYYYNENALMTTTIWQEILHFLDIEMQKFNRKIVLFVDDASCHKTPQLRNIMVYFLQPNTTIITQPLGQGIITSFKAYYRQLIVRKKISALARDMTIRDFYKSISYLDALHFIKQAWWLVTPSCISNSFKKAGFNTRTLENQIEINAEDNLLNIVPNYIDYIHCDDSEKCCEDADETVNDFIKSELIIDEQNGYDQKDDEHEDMNDIPSLKEALMALNVLQKYCFLKNIDISLDQIETEIVKAAVVNVVDTDPLEFI